MADDDALSISFIERVDLVAEFINALDLSREALEDVLEGDCEALTTRTGLTFPALRFVYLNAYRYVFASRFLRDDDLVLDIPCGTGYGTAILASNGNKVIGFDIHEPTILRASDIFKFPNMEFCVGDMMTCRLPEADFITCLDGLEHVEDGERLIERFCAALSDRGILVITVPINELKITRGQQNPWHFRDYTPDSLYKMLSRYFRRVTLFGHDEMGSISDVGYAMDGVTAICEV